MNVIKLSFLFGILVIFGSFNSAHSAYTHGGDTDSDVFLQVYPDKAGTKLDSCTLCHKGGQGNKGPIGSCQWCHQVYGYDASGDIDETINTYGLDYRSHGRDEDALTEIETLDSDVDSFSNAEEIAVLRFPGNANDDPTKVPAPYQVITREELELLSLHTQFLLMNTTKSGDFYAEYTGVTVGDLLDEVGVLSLATGIKVYSPDGFSQTHPLEPDPDPDLYHVYGNYPAGNYYYNVQADQNLNPDGWCDYSAPSNKGRGDGDPIVNSNGLKMILAITRDGEFLQTGVLNEDNKLDGEGPFRVVPPQKLPGPPDQSSRAENAEDPTVWIWPYDEDGVYTDHNAGYSSRTVTMIGVYPLPEGTTDIDTLEAGWNFVDENKIMVYGAIDPVATIDEKLADLVTILKDLNFDEFKSPANKKVFILQATNIQWAINRGMFQSAQSRLESVLLKKVDGCMSANTPDSNDWLVDCNNQKQVYWSLNEVLVLLKSII